MRYVTKLICLPAMFFTGCTMLHSDPGDGTNILEYSLPMTVLELAVTQSAAADTSSSRAPAAEVGAANHVAGAALPAPGPAGPIAPSPPLPPSAPASTKKASLKYDLFYRFADVPDPRHHYRIRYTASPFSDDKFTLGVNDDGLLNQLNASPRDRTPDFFKKIGELAVETAKAAASLGATFPGAPKDTDKTVLRLFVDPSRCGEQLPCQPSPADAARLAAYGYRVYFRPLVPPEAISNSNPRAETCTGVCFRAKQSVALVVEERSNRGWIMRDSIIVGVPNFSPVFNVAMTRSVGVERSALATVTSGYLTKFDFTKNSEALAVIEVPIELAKDVASIVPALIGIRTTRADDLNKLETSRQTLFTTKQAGLAQNVTASDALQGKILDARKTVIDKQAELLKSQAALEQLQSSATSQ